MEEIKEAPKPKTQNGPRQTKEMVPPTSTAQKSSASPFAFMRRFAQEMDHLFEDFGLEPGLYLPGFLGRGRELLRREAVFVRAEWSPPDTGSSWARREPS
jgi:hypothetical protein